MVNIYLHKTSLKDPTSIRRNLRIVCVIKSGQFSAKSEEVIKFSRGEAERLNQTTNARFFRTLCPPEEKQMF